MADQEPRGTRNFMSGRIDRAVQAQHIDNLHIHQEVPDGPRRPRLFMVPPKTHRVVERPELTEAVVESLLTERSGELVLLTGLSGAGGFGKTTTAAHVCRDQRVRDHFTEVLWVTLGEGVHGNELAARLNDLCAQLSGEKPLFVDAEQAGYHLGTLLDSEPRLLVIDDVWTAAQLSPFLIGGERCARLVTTRIARLLPAGPEPIVVGRMSTTEARELLTDGWPRPPADVGGLLQRTGRWPVLLRLVNGTVRKHLKYRADLSEAIRLIEEQLAEKGPAALDITDAGQRDLAVAATVEASLRALSREHDPYLHRYLEMAIFPEDTEIPLENLATYWEHTGGLDEPSTIQLCMELAELSLIDDCRLDSTPGVRLHDVVRDYLRHRTGFELKSLHGSFVEAHRKHGTAWWQLPGRARYIERYLAYHLAEAEMTEELANLVCDPRWIARLLLHWGPSSVEADLSRASSPTADLLAKAVRQNVHTLGPIVPSHAMLPTLLSRLSGYTELTNLVSRHSRRVQEEHLAPIRPFEAPHPAIIRSIPTGASVKTVKISPDGTWLAAIPRFSERAQTWRWDGTPLAMVEVPGTIVSALAIGPDSTWLATSHEPKHAGDSKDTAKPNSKVCFWSVDGTQTAVIESSRWRIPLIDGAGILLTKMNDELQQRDRAGRVLASTSISQIQLRVADPLKISANGTTLAGVDGVTVWLWTANGIPSGTFAGHIGNITDFNFSSDGRLLATASKDGTVRLTTLAGDCITRFIGHDGDVKAVALSPDGTWLVTGGLDGTLRLWRADGSLVETIHDHKHAVNTVAISPDGSWFASGCEDGTVRLWDPALICGVSHRAADRNVFAVAPDHAWIVEDDPSGGLRLQTADGTEQRPLRHSEGFVASCAAVSPDGAWLVAGNFEGAVAIWRTADGHRTSTAFSGHRRIHGITVDPLGTFIATSGQDNTVRTWDEHLTAKRVLKGTKLGWAHCVAASPTGGWLVAGYELGLAIVWGASGDELVRLDGHARDVWAAAVSPDGQLIATGSTDWSVRLWRPDGSAIGVLPGHTAAITAVEFSPDGRTLASLDRGSTIRIWDAAELHCRTALRLEDRMRNIHWHQDSQRLTISGGGGWVERSVSGRHELRLIPRKKP